MGEKKLLVFLVFCGLEFSWQVVFYSGLSYQDMPNK